MKWVVAMVLMGAAGLILQAEERLAALKRDGAYQVLGAGSMASHAHSFADFWRHLRGVDRGPWPVRLGSRPGPRPAERIEGLSITWVNQATVLIQMEGLNLLTDPIWSDRAGKLGIGPLRVCDPGLRFEDLPSIDAVLISHNHYDHLDLATLKRIAKVHHCPIITPLGNGKLLREAGFPEVRELDWWASTTIGGVTLHAVPALHGSRRGLMDTDEALWSGFVIQGSRHGARPVFFAGDTAYGPHFAQIRQAFGPLQASLLPIGSYLPRSMMSAQHLSPEEALKAAQELGADCFIPIHYATFPDGDDGYDQPLEDLQTALKAAPHQREQVRVLPMGQALNF